MGVFGESHKRACTSSQKAGRGRRLLIFQRRKKGPRGGFCPKTGEVGIGPSSWWESPVWTAVQLGETAVTSLGLSFPLCRSHRGTAGSFFLLKRVCITWLL